MLATAWSLMSLLLIVLAADTLGRPLATAWPLAPPTPALTARRWPLAAWRVCLGLVAGGCILTALAFVGLLKVHLIWMLTASAAGLTAARWLTAPTRSLKFLQAEGNPCGGDNRPTGQTGDAQPCIDHGPEDATPPGWLSHTLGAFTLAAAGASLVVALAPATDGDALCYHLALPKYFLDAGGFRHLPYHDNSTFPLLVEMLYAWGLALDGAVTAQLIHWLFGGLFAAATYLLALDVFTGPSDSQRRHATAAADGWAKVAAVIALVTPAVTNQMTAAFNDLALATFTTFALVAWRQAVRPSVGTGEPQHGGFVASGIMAGAALSTKYLALMFAVAMAFAWLIQLVSRRGLRGRLLAGAAVVAVVSAAVAGPWYARAAALRGNPVYPFLGDVFATSGPQTDRPDKRPLDVKAADIAAASWQITMQPEQFGGRGHQLGVLFLAILPGVCLVRRLPRLWLLLAIVAVYVTLWYTMRQNLRFLLPMVPLLAVAVAAAWQMAVRFGGLPGWLITGAAVAALAFNTAQAMSRARGEVAVVLGMESREAYLQRHVPTYLASAFAARYLPPDARILSQDYRQFHFPCEVTQENVYRRETGYHKALPAACSLPEHLAAAGFTHLLLMDVEGSEIRHSTTLLRLVEAATDSGGKTKTATLSRTVDTQDGPAQQNAASQQDNAFRTLLAYEHRAISGERRRYRLVEINALTNRTIVRR